VKSPTTTAATAPAPATISPIQVSLWFQRFDTYPPPDRIARERRGVFRER
jgi:hypothetical protein